MFIDSFLEFSDAQALTATAVSTNVVDLGGDFDVGVGKPVWVVVSIDVALDGTTGDETYQVDVQTDDNVGFSSPTVIDTFTMARGSAAGTRFVHAIPFANERFLRLNYTLGGTTPTGTVSAWLTDQHPTAWQAYPDAVN